MARAGPGEWALQHSGTGRCPAAPSQHTLQQRQCSVRGGWHAQGGANTATRHVYGLNTHTREWVQFFALFAGGPVAPCPFRCWCR